MLSDADILRAFSSGAIRITASPETRDIQPNSVDVHLGTSFAALVRPIGGVHHLRDKCLIEKFTIPVGSEYLVPPRGFVLATLHERVELDATIAARIEGKSSIGRAGLIIQTAGFVDAGYKGNLTLELANLTDHYIGIEPLLPIAQLAFFRLDSPAQRPYGHPEHRSAYQNDSEVNGSQGAK